MRLIQLFTLIASTLLLIPFLGALFGVPGAKEVFVSIGKLLAPYSEHVKFVVAGIVVSYVGYFTVCVIKERKFDCNIFGGRVVGGLAEAFSILIVAVYILYL